MTMLHVYYTVVNMHIILGKIAYDQFMIVIVEIYRTIGFYVMIANHKLIINKLNKKAILRIHGLTFVNEYV